MNKKIQAYIFGIILSVIVTIGAVNTAYTQEAGYLNHSFLQPILFNPGATGFQGDHQLLAGYKHMWSDFPDAPRTFTALYNGSFADNLGLGFQVLTDQVGLSNVLHGQLNFAYKLTFDEVVLSAGISAGLETFHIKGTQDDPLLDPNDVLLNEAIDGYTLFDGGLGVYGEVKEKLFFGVSFPNLVKNHLRYSPFLIDANLKFSFLDEQLVGGVGYTLGDNSRASLLLGTRINHLRIYYSYDVSLGDFQQYNNGSHEITLVYRIPKKVAQAAE